MLPIVIKVLLVIHVIVSLFIILLVLMQRPKNEGLGAAFGGGATDQLFGAQTTNVLQTLTRWLGGIFFALTLLLSILYVKQGGGRSPIQDKLSAKSEAPAPPVQVPAADGVPNLEANTAVTAPVSGTPPPVPADAKDLPEKPAPPLPVPPVEEKKTDAPESAPKPAEPAK